MKFQLKALAAALALAVTLPAHAAIDKANTGNGSLVLTLLDRVGGISATFDLGKNYSDFSVAPNVAANIAPSGGFLASGIDAAGTTLTWDLTQGNYSAAYSSFLAKSSFGNTFYGVTAGDLLGPSTSGGRGYITTYDLLTPGTGITTANVATAVGVLDTYLTQVNTEGNHPTVADGASSAISGQGYAGGGTFLNNRLNNVGPTSLGALGANLGVTQVSLFGTGTTQANQYIFANNAHFNLSNGGLLTYSTTAVAAVPEADTWAMMFMGLGLMGFIARRKQA